MCNTYNIQSTCSLTVYFIDKATSQCQAVGKALGELKVTLGIVRGQGVSAPDLHIAQRSTVLSFKVS